MTTRNYGKPMVLFVALLAAVAFMAQAQTGAGEVTREGKTLLEYWTVGGFAMYPIGLCSVLGMALSVYCYMQYRSVKMIQPHLVQPLRDALGQLDVAQATTICNSSPGILSNVLTAGLRRVSEDGNVEIAEIEKAMEEASIEEVNNGMKPLTYISVVSQVAPMFGLLGTVTGMIGAFNKIGMGAMGDPEKLADNIGEAMITTAFGLIVAIPAMFAYFGFKAQYTSNISRISRVLGDIIHHFGDAIRRSAGQPATLPPQV